jgi:5S rRNA maturation endonuclease (ribonuclease M5)
MQRGMKLKKKLQEALKSKQIEIKRMRTKPKTNTKWRTKLNFSRPGTKTKTRREKQRAGEKTSSLSNCQPPWSKCHSTTCTISLHIE